MLRIQKLFLEILLFIVAALFAFVPKSFADDPCSPIENPPLLYQINRTPTQATLFFTPIANDQAQSYAIIYGYKPEDERFSLTVNQGTSTGAISVVINDLEPGIQYFYKVSGSTNCVSSPWSSWEGDKAVTKGSSTAIPGIPVTGPNTMIAGIGLAFLLFIGGLGIFFFSTKKPKYFY